MTRTYTYTPGPWRVDESGFHKENGEVMEQTGRQVCPHCRQPGSPSPVTMQVLAFDREHRSQWGVCQLGSYDPKAEYAEHLANARLIAAAPELLDALKTARRVLEVACGTKAPYIVEAFKVIDPAIAKAEGR